MAGTEIFDYVVVGGGSAGCVMASRLSEDPTRTVCLLEAGLPDKSPFIHVPLGVLNILSKPKYNWMFNGTKQEGMRGGQLYVPRGKTLGGSSSINGMVYIRGHRTDYDDWAALGNSGWSFNDVLPYFKKSENNEDLGDDPLHGNGGPLNVMYRKRFNRVNETLFEVTDSMQFKRTNDFNGAEQDGWGYMQLTQKRGRRWSTARAYLDDKVRARPNLKVITSALASKVVIEGGRAVGVEYRRGGVAMRADARGEVVISAGGIVSPKLLMLSGIGNPDWLREHGIPVVKALPGVGKNLQDHFAAWVQYQTESREPYGISAMAMPRLAWEFLVYAFARDGLLATNIFESGGFIRTLPELSRPDIQMSFLPAFRGPPGKLLVRGHGFLMIPILLRPKSRGEIRLAGTDPASPPLIDHKVYSDPDDVETLYRGYKIARRILSAPEFQKYRGKEIVPGENVQDDDAVKEVMRKYTQIIHHPAGTCKMGTDDDPNAVLDNRLRVRGIHGLRVVDTSVMPTIVGGNTNAPTVMIAEKASDMMARDTRA
jgi:choline dehydrogenase-like flavoprotein